MDQAGIPELPWQRGEHRKFCWRFRRCEGFVHYPLYVFTVQGTTICQQVSRFEWDGYGGPQAWAQSRIDRYIRHVLESQVTPAR